MCSSAGVFDSGVLLVLPTFLRADVGSSLPSLPLVSTGKVVVLAVRAQARFRRQIGVLQSTVAVYIVSNGGNDEEDC